MPDNDPKPSPWGMAANRDRKACEHLNRGTLTETLYVKNGDATIAKHRHHECCIDCHAKLRLISSELESDTMEPPK